MTPYYPGKINCQYYPGIIIIRSFPFPLHWQEVNDDGSQSAVGEEVRHHSRENAARLGVDQPKNPTRDNLRQQLKRRIQVAFSHSVELWAEKISRRVGKAE